MKKYYIFIVVAFICLSMFIVLIDRLWRGIVIRSVQQSNANSSQSTVGKVLADMYSARSFQMRWRVENGDFPYLEARVFCDIIPVSNTNSRATYVWQWDFSWPSARALTPDTVTLCPDLDPGCFLTSDGRSTLNSGSKAIPIYFKQTTNDVRSKNSSGGK